MTNIGERVGAILCQEEDRIEFLGYGVYEGDFFPAEAVGAVAKDVQETRFTNPRIRLDNGKVVYGCECWWGNEDEIKSALEEHVRHGYKIIERDIDKVREEYKREEQSLFN